MNKIVVLGGTFNPITKAHAHILKSAAKKVKATKMILVPTADSFITSWKNYSKESILAPDIRLECMDAFVKRNKNVTLSLLEYSGETSKTFDTLNALALENPDSEIYFVCGSEKLKELHTWYKFDELLYKYKFVIVERNNDNIMDLFNENRELSKYKNSFIFLKQNNRYESVSSTKLREAINKKEYKNIEDYTFKYVLSILKKNGLM